ncbi:uncharacterized protein METZ01_LOCUS328675 [marine metagenome]|uniref:Uncharacterized protein n=1 Tax=marine metagenome TaxID=408172 RepID=A0A382PV23_9ZZZZ
MNNKLNMLSETYLTHQKMSSESN